MRKKPESIQNTELYHIRDEIVDWVLLACSALGIVAQTFATLRMIFIGFSYVIMSQNLIVIALIGITIKRKSIGLSVKTAIVLFIIYAIFLSSFVKFGFLASSKVYLVIAPIFGFYLRLQKNHHPHPCKRGHLLCCRISFYQRNTHLQF